MRRTRRGGVARHARWTAGLLALSSGLIGDLTHADPDPGAAPQQALVLQPSFAVQETFTDNADFTASDKVSDLVTRALVSLQATLDTGRANGQLNTSVGYDAYARQSALDGWFATGNGSASYVVLPNLLTLKADGSTNEGSISTFGLSATDRHGAPDLTRLITYDVGPELTGLTPDGLEVRAAARFAQVLYSNISSGPLPLPGDDSMVQLTGAVATDPTRRLQLENSAEYLRDAQDFTSVSDVQSAFFRVDVIRLIGRVGYDDISQGRLLQISAPLGSVGFEYQPNSFSTITVEGGSRYDRPAWAADARIEFSPRLLATASYVDEIQPDQVGVARSFLAFTQLSQNLPPPLVPAAFGVPTDVTNATSWSRSGTLRVIYHDEVNTFGVTADWTDHEYLTIPGRDRTLLLDADFSRRVRPDLTFLIHADYGETLDSPVYGPSRAVGGSVQLAYRLNSRTDLDVTFSRTQSQEFVGAGERVTENALLLELRRTL